MEYQCEEENLRNSDYNNFINEDNYVEENHYADKTHIINNAVSIDKECLMINEYNKNVQSHQNQNANFSSNNIQNKWKLQQFPDADVLIKSETKNLIFIRVFDEVQLNELERKQFQIKDEMQLIKETKLEILTQNENLLSNLELGKHDLIHLEKVMKNTGEIISKLNENIIKLQQTSNNINVLELYKQVEANHEKYMTSNNYFTAQIQFRNNEISLLKRSIENVCNQDRELFEEYKQKNLILKLQINDINQQLEELNSEENNKSLELDKKQQDLQNEKQQIQEKFDLLQIKIENLKDSIKTDGIENTTKIEGLKEMKTNRLNDLKNSKQTKYKINQEIKDLMQILNSTEACNRNLENENEILEDKRKEFEILFDEKTKSFIDNKGKFEKLLEELSDNLKNLENDFQKIFEEKDKLNNELNVIKNEYLSKREENNKFQAENEMQKNYYEKIQNRLNDFQNENIIIKEKIEGLQKNIKSTETGNEIKSHEILNKNLQYQQLYSVEEEHYEKLLKENSKCLDEIDKKKIYVLKSKNYFEEGINKLQEEVYRKDKDIEKIVKERLNTLDDNNNIKLLTDKLKQQLNQLKLENEKLTSNNFVKQEYDDNKVIVQPKSSILRSPGNNTNRTPPKKVHFTDLISQVTTESDSIPDDKKSDSMDDLLNKIRMRCFSQSSAGSSNNDNSDLM